MFEIQCQTSFRMILLKEIGALGCVLVFRRARLQALKSGSVSTRSNLDLDDVRTGFGQVPGSGRPGDKLRDIQHTITGEHFWGQTHVHSLLAASV